MTLRLNKNARMEPHDPPSKAIGEPLATIERNHIFETPNLTTSKIELSAPNPPPIFSSTDEAAVRGLKPDLTAINGILYVNRSHQSRQKIVSEAMTVCKCFGKQGNERSSPGSGTRSSFGV